MTRHAITRASRSLPARMCAAGMLVTALSLPSLVSTPAAGARSLGAASGSTRCRQHGSRRCPPESHRGAARHLRAGKPSPQGRQSSSGEASTAPCANTEIIPSRANISLVASATLCLINRQRTRDGERPLSNDPDLDRSALQHSQEMVTANYFDHVSPAGTTPLSRIEASGYVPRGDAYELGENIALGTGAMATPAAIVSAWMKSPDHRANILDPDFVDSGIGVVAQAPAAYAGGATGATYTQDFGVLAAP